MNKVVHFAGGQFADTILLSQSLQGADSPLLSADTQVQGLLPHCVQVSGSSGSPSLGIGEVVVGFDEIVDSEVVLAGVQSDAAADNLFGFDHIVAGPQQDDIAHLAGIHPGGEFAGCGKGGEGFFVVLKGFQIVVADATVVGDNADTVAGVGGAAPAAAYSG